MRRVLWVAALLAACDDPVEEHTIEAIEAACVDGDELVVRFATCLSSSCDTLLSATCAASASGDEVTVTGSARVRSQGRECTDDCGAAEARCAVPAGVDPSTAVLRFAGDGGGRPLSDAACTDD